MDGTSIAKDIQGEHELMDGLGVGVANGISALTGENATDVERDVALMTLRIESIANVLSAMEWPEIRGAAPTFDILKKQLPTQLCQWSSVD